MVIAVGTAVASGAALGGSVDDTILSIRRSYDAIARLEKIACYDNAAGTLTYEHEYDGLNRRIVKTLVIGTFRVGFHYYYNTNWQVLETRVESGGDCPQA